MSKLLCAKCGKNERYERNGRVFRLCASCAWTNLLIFVNESDKAVEQSVQADKCPTCENGIIYDAEFDKWFNCSDCFGTGIRR